MIPVILITADGGLLRVTLMAKVFAGGNETYDRGLIACPVCKWPPTSRSPVPDSRRRGMLAAGGAAILGAVGGYALAAGQDSQQPLASSTPEPPSAAPSPAATSSAVPVAVAATARDDSLLRCPSGRCRDRARAVPDLRRPGPDRARRRAAPRRSLRLITDDAARLTQGQTGPGRHPARALHERRPADDHGRARAHPVPADRAWLIGSPRSCRTSRASAPTHSRSRGRRRTCCCRSAPTTPSPSPTPSGC